MSNYQVAFEGNTRLITELGQSSAHLVWTMGLYLGENDLFALASEALTDGPDDKKLDFIFLDVDSKRIIFAQGYYAQRARDAAPANKASDLNTAAAWLFSGHLDEVPETMRPAIQDCRAALANNEIESIELLYIHNLPESVNVTRELQTTVSHLRRAIASDETITVLGREFGRTSIERLYDAQETAIRVREEIVCPAEVLFEESGPNWKAAVLTVPGIWLHELFSKHQDDLFSANYRGFLGITKRRTINTAIRQTAESLPANFWVYNNGVTVLTLSYKPHRDGTLLHGLSIINGAQTTGSIGAVDLTKLASADVRVLCRVIECSDPETVDEIVKYNNTQNEITTWDQYSNDPEQRRIDKEFEALGHGYSRKRGFGKPQLDAISVEDVIQPLLAFQGRFVEASRGRNSIFESKSLYKAAFENKSARHILFVYTLARAIDERRLELKKKSDNQKLIAVEQKQLELLRHFRFKNFFIAIVAKLLETVLGKQIDPSHVAFTEVAAKRSAYSILDLIAIWTPLVEKLLAMVGPHIKGELYELIRKDNILSEITDIAASVVYVNRAALECENFCSIVTPTGH